MKANAEAMVLASFAADSLALGAHWIYDTALIDRTLGRVTELRKPEPPTYHPTKERGGFTHYGDQTLLLLESLAECRGFHRDRFIDAWRRFMASYGGYIDGASRQTLKNIDAGKPPAEAGSSSNDLAGAARIAPLVYRFREDLQKLVESCRQQTALTHNTPAVIDAAEFFGRVVWHVLHGHPPAESMRRVAAEELRQPPVPEWVEAGLASAGHDTRSAIGRFGQACEAEAAFPATVHLIASYPGRLEIGLVENVMAGGDSAARGLLAGMVLGAHNGLGALPDRWIAGLAARNRITGLLKQLDLHMPGDPA
jgi:ADP-ribosylglycohydrolase